MTIPVPHTQLCYYRSPGQVCAQCARAQRIADRRAEAKRTADLAKAKADVRRMLADPKLRTRAQLIDALWTYSQFDEDAL